MSTSRADKDKNSEWAGDRKLEKCEGVCRETHVRILKKSRNMTKNIQQNVADEGVKIMHLYCSVKSSWPKRDTT